VRCLGLDTSSATLSLAVTAEGLVLAELSVDVSVARGERLVEHVASVLELAGCEFAGIEAIVVGAGPGSYTGLRIGYSVAKALAYASGKPLYEVSSLRMLCLEQARMDVPLVPLLDARVDEIYYGLYRWTERGLLCLRDDAVGTLDDLVGLCDGPRMIVGEGTRRFGAELLALPKGTAFELAPGHPARPRVASALLELEAGIATGSRPTPADLAAVQSADGHAVLTRLEPRYLRPSEAERRQHA